MMPDLGSYAIHVTLAYAVSLSLLAAIVALSVWQSRRIRKQLDAAEDRHNDG